MKKFIVAFSTILFLFTFSSCKKENLSTPTLVGKWKLSKYIYKVNSITVETYNGQSTDYVDFKTNNTYESSFDGEKETGTYSISGSTVKIDGDDYKIENLTTSSVTLSSKYVELGTTLEDFIYLVK